MAKLLSYNAINSYAADFSDRIYEYIHCYNVLLYCTNVVEVLLFVSRANCDFFLDNVKY